MSIIFGLILGLALLFFCIFFVANAPAQSESATEEVAETGNESAESEVASTTANEPKLSAQQQAELANVKELYELGAYTEEEYNAEVQRIKLYHL